jgi:hypothetical protein
MLIVPSLFYFSEAIVIMADRGLCISCRCVGLSGDQLISECIGYSRCHIGYTQLFDDVFAV